MKMNFKIYLITIVVISFGLFATPMGFLFAQETEQDLQAIIVQLQQQIESLQVQIEQLKSELTATKSELVEVKAELKFSRTLHRGVSGDDVLALQEFLKQFPDIYPEGLVTGYFGHLTETAVQRLQEKENIVSGGTPITTGYGQVGPKTREKLNDLVTNSVGSSGKIPPGLLTTPGVQDKIATTTATTTTEAKIQGPPSVTPSGTIPATPAEPAIPPSGGGGGGGAMPATPATPATPAEPEPDTTPPTISNVQSANITETSATITWTTDESASSEVYYASSSPIFSVATTTLKSTGADSVASHSVNLLNLTASTVYYYAVVSTDAVGNTATSSEQSFTTLTQPTPTTWINTRVTNASGSSLYPSIAWNGNGYGVVWSDSRDGGEPEVYFAVIDENGQKIINDTKISATSTLISYNPKIVWNGTEYAIVYSQYDRHDSSVGAVYFARINASGTKIGNEIVIDKTPHALSQAHPNIIWNGSGYGITWRGTPTYTTYFSFLSSSANILTDKAPVFNGLGVAQIDNLIWDGTAFASIWRIPPFNPPGNTYLTRFDINGTKIGGDITVSPSVVATELTGWKLTWDGSAYGVLFQGYDSNGFRQQYYMRVNSSGSTLISGVKITNNTAVDGGLLPGNATWGNNALAIIYNVSDSHLYFSEINLDGSIKTIPVKIDNTTNQARSPHIIWNGNKYVIVWDDSRHISDDNTGNVEIYFATGN